MDEIELLRAIYRSLDWHKLYEVAPEADRDAVDEFFIRLRNLVQASGQEVPCKPVARAAARGFKRLELYCDGASSRNPGPSAIGLVLQDPSGQEIIARGEYIGRATNNVAEYRALIEAVKEALQLRAESVSIFSDSELVVLQILGTYKVKNPRLRSLHARAKELLKQFESWELKHIPRQKNSRANAIAGEQIKAHKRGKFHK